MEHIPWTIETIPWWIHPIAIITYLAIGLVSSLWLMFWANNKLGDS